MKTEVTFCVLAQILCLLLFPTSGHAADTFFGDKPSQKEKARFERHFQAMTKSVEALDDMSIALQYDAFQKGDCTAFLEIESKAKEHNPKSE